MQRAHLVGHSTGGAICRSLAIDRPERVDRLVLCGTSASANRVVMDGMTIRFGISTSPIMPGEKSVLARGGGAMAWAPTP